MYLVRNGKTTLFLFLFPSLLILSGCTASPPKHIDNICQIFREKDDWYDYSKDSYEKWGISIHIQMAFIHQESRFVSDARPPRKWLLGIIPWFRPSSAYGYGQIQNGTWEDYLEDAGSWTADRDDFEDVVDFIGWYGSLSHRKLGISKSDTNKQYLAYHEGHGGYRRKTYLKKSWLMKTARKLADRANRYNSQLKGCKDEMESNSWFF